MEPFVHALIPLAFLLALFQTLEKKYIFTLVPIVWLIDLDIFFGIHRFTFHNLFFVLGVALLIYMLWDAKAFFIAFYYGISHLILDLAYPGSGWLYPLVDKTFYLVSTVHRDAGHWLVSFHIGSLTLDEYLSFAQTVGPDRYIGEASVIFILLFALLVIIKYRKRITSVFSKRP